MTREFYYLEINKVPLLIRNYNYGSGSSVYLCIKLYLPIDKYNIIVFGGIDLPGYSNIDIKRPKLVRRLNGFARLPDNGTKQTLLKSPARANSIFHLTMWNMTVRSGRLAIRKLTMLIRW